MLKKIIDLLKNPYVLIGINFGILLFGKTFLLLFGNYNPTLSQQITKISRSVNPLVGPYLPLLFLACFLFVCFLGPLFEELVYRSWLSKRFEKYMLPFLCYSFMNLLYLLNNLLLLRLNPKNELSFRIGELLHYVFSSNMLLSVQLRKIQLENFNFNLPIPSFIIGLLVFIFIFNIISYLIQKVFGISIYNKVNFFFKKFNIYLLILISAVTFAGFHNTLQSISIISLIFGSLLLGYTTYKLNLKIAIYLHSFWNIIVTFTFIKLENNIFDVWFYYLVYLTSSVLVIFLFFKEVHQLNKLATTVSI
jgi:membrane protease YdiL (CAAX protease family)